MRLVLLAVACFLMLIASLASAGQSALAPVAFGNDFDGREDQAQYTLNGNAVAVEGMIRLVPSTYYQVGSVFLKEMIDVPSWQADFDFKVSEPNDMGPADGLAFVFTGSRRTLGGGGGGLGALGLGGYAVEFDSFTNTESSYWGGIPWSPGDPGVLDEIRPHVGITSLNQFESLCINEDIPPYADTGWFHVTVCFNSGRVQVYLSNEAVKFGPKLVIDYTIKDYKRGPASFGLTAATGRGTAEYDVDNFFISIP